MYTPTSVDFSDRLRSVPSRGLLRPLGLTVDSVRRSIMSDIETIFVTAACTILGGVTVYVTGQLLSKVFINPLQTLRKTIGETRFNLAFHASEIHTPIGRTPGQSEKARDALLQNSCYLLASRQIISIYWLASTFRLAPPRRSIEDAAVHLRALSTYVHETAPEANTDVEVIAKRVKRIETLLRCKPLG